MEEVDQMYGIDPAANDKIVIRWADEYLMSIN